MLIKLDLDLEVGHVPGNMQVVFTDRYNQLSCIESVDQLSIKLSFDFSVPNQLFIDILNQDSNFIRLKTCRLGGLDLPQHILNQVCQFIPSGSKQQTITTLWNQSGKVYIDFFAADWIQYHLLYGNKITV